MNHPPLQELLQPLADGVPVAVRIVILVLLLWGCVAAIVAGFGMMIGGPAWATSVMRALFVEPLRFLIAQTGFLLIKLPAFALTGTDRVLRGLVRILLGRRP